MNNSHVYVYYRWRGWVAEKLARHMSAFFLREFAQQELDQAVHFENDNK